MITLLDYGAGNVEGVSSNAMESLGEQVRVVTGSEISLAPKSWSSLEWEISAA